jgi:LCP family protein required for cell wall assembly
LVLLLLVSLPPLALLAFASLTTPVRETVLILGSDARPDEIQRGDVGRTDTLLVLVADRARPKVAMVSLPRDLWVTIPGYGEERVNAAYALGGAETAEQTVSGVLGVALEHHALIGLQGVRDVVDALGGIEINVTAPIHDPAYPTDDYRTIEVNIPAGPQHMNGETALRYARTRHQDSDFGRIVRQQQVLSAVRAALANPASWPRLPAVAAAAQRSIKTDLSLLDVVAIGAAFLRAPGEMERLALDTSLVTPFEGAGGAALLAPQQPAVRRAVADLLGERVAAIEVLNGAGTPGLARATADRLQQRGFTVAGVGDADRPQTQTALVARPGMRGTAERVAEALNLAAGRVSESQTLPSGVDVRVVLGADASQ